MEKFGQRKEKTFFQPLWEWAYEVDVDVLEAFLGHFKPMERSLHMDLDLVALTAGACAGPSGHVRFG